MAKLICLPIAIVGVLYLAAIAYDMYRNIFRPPIDWKMVHLFVLVIMMLGLSSGIVAKVAWETFNEIRNETITISDASSN